MSKKCRVGYFVIWRGGWGRDEPKTVKVTALSPTKSVRGKDIIEEVEEVDWERITDNRCIVSLDTGNWAYGEQIEPAPKPKSVDFIRED